MKKRGIRRSLTLFLLASAVYAQPQSPAQVDAIFAPLAGRKTPGLAVLVRKDGRTVFSAATVCVSCEL